MKIESFYLNFEQTRQIEKCLKFQIHWDLFMRTISIMCAEVLKGMVVAHILRTMSHSNRRATSKLSTDQSFVLKAKLSYQCYSMRTKYFWSVLIRNLGQYRNSQMKLIVKFYRILPEKTGCRRYVFTTHCLYLFARSHAIFSRAR